MAHDEKLKKRIRDILQDNPAFTEKNMFGGICFLNNGNMLCGADSKNGLMARVGPEQYEKTLKLKHANKMSITGKPMKGFLFISPQGYTTKQNLKKWINKAITFTNTLPKK